MPRRLTNLALLGLVAALVASGLAGWIWPVGDVAASYPLHRVLGAAVVVVLGWKWGIARGSLARRGARSRSVWAGLVAAIALGGCVGLGLAWTLGFVSFAALWGYSPLNVHVYLGFALLGSMALHAAGRWERRPAIGRLLTRRAALGLGGMTLAGAAAAWLLEPAAGAARRFTGSKHAGSFSANAYPTTIWLADQIPALDPPTWRLSVAGRVAAPISFTYEQLTKILPQRELAAVIDCTGGWWSAQQWRGPSVGDLLEAAGVDAAASAATVTSVTGHAWSFPLAELRGALLATHVGGEPLAPGHGFPARLAAPGRRGFQWVKWVDRIDVH